jgi:hypothetical protein
MRCASFWFGGCLNLPFRRKLPVLSNFNLTQIFVIFRFVFCKSAVHLCSEAAKMRNENKHIIDGLDGGRGSDKHSGHTQCKNTRDAPNMQASR